MLLLCLLFSLITCPCFKIVKDIHSWVKVCGILIHPLLVFPISNNWSQSSVTQRRPNNLSKITMDMDQLHKKLEEALEELDVITEERENLKKLEQI